MPFPEFNDALLILFMVPLTLFPMTTVVFMCSLILGFKRVDGLSSVILTVALMIVYCVTGSLYIVEVSKGMGSSAMVFLAYPAFVPYTSMFVTLLGFVLGWALGSYRIVRRVRM